MNTPIHSIIRGQKRSPPLSENELKTILDQTVNRIVENFHPDKIILFGSFAKGVTTADSDIDLLIVMSVESSCRSKANEIDLSLSDRTVPMDLIVITPNQYDEQKEMVGTVIFEAAHEGRILYERAA